MLLVTGGLFQGQKEYALELMGLSPEQVLEGGDCDFDDAFGATAINDFHLIIKRLLEAGWDANQYAKELIEKNPKAVIIMDEVGCGIVPAKSEERLYRETTGRISCELAKASDRVYRVFCGIGTCIKG